MVRETMAVNFRVVVMFVSVGCAILCAVTLAFITIAITEYRLKDFFVASDFEDFSELGTCVEALTDKQLRRENYHDPYAECRPNRERGTRAHVRNSLAVSVHGLYYTKFAHDAAAYEETVPPTYYTSDVETALNAATSAAITATVGGAAKEVEALGKETEKIWQDVCQASGVETPPAHWNGRLPEGVNYTTAYLAMHYVAQQNLPSSCDEIYGLTSGTIKENRFGQVEFIEAIRKGKYDGKYELGPHIPIKDRGRYATSSLTATTMRPSLTKRWPQRANRRERTQLTYPRVRFRTNRRRYCTPTAMRSMNMRALERSTTPERG